MINPYERLAHAIILQAVHDYRRARKVLVKNPKNEAAFKHTISCERFFCSEWFAELSNADGSELLKQLQTEVIKC